MNLEQKGKEIILNDTFQTKRINAYNLLLASEDYQSPGIIKKGKEILTYRIDDLQDIKYNVETRYGYYNHTINYSPANWQFDWRNANDVLNYDPDLGWAEPDDTCNVLNILSTPQTNASEFNLAVNYPGLRGAIFINDCSTGTYSQFSRRVPDLPNTNDLTGISKCEFTIGILPIHATGKRAFGSIALYTNECTALNKNFFKDNSKFSAQSSYISHGYGSEGYGGFYVFRAYCVTPDEVEPDNCIWEIYAYDNWSTNATVSTGTKIQLNAPGKNGGSLAWDGLSFIKFYSEIIKNNNGTITKCLYFNDNIYDDNGNIIGTEKKYIFNTTVTVNSAKLPTNKLYNKVAFGSWGTAYYSCLVIKDFLFCPDTKYEYNMSVGTGTVPAIDAFMPYQAERTSCIIGCSAPFTASWDFIRSQLDEKDDIGFVIKVNDKKDYQSTGIGTTKVALDDDLITSGKNTDKCNIFSSKDKQVTIEAPIGEIFAVTCSNKNVYYINYSQLSNLTEVDVSNNLLSKLDLSNCTKLKTVNVSGNDKLRKLILPHTLTTNITVNVSGCSSLYEIVFPYKEIDGKTITLIVDANVKLKTIQLTNTGSSDTTLIIDGDMSGILSNLTTLSLQKVNSTAFLTFPDNCPIKEINISEAPYLTTLTTVQNLINSLPSITGEPGRLYMYGKKYTVNSIQGSINEIAAEIEIAKNKNWLIYT